MIDWDRFEPDRAPALDATDATDTAPPSDAPALDAADAAVPMDTLDDDAVAPRTDVPCHPACSGAACGASDHCGGTCGAGSGCATAAVFTVPYANAAIVAAGCTPAARASRECDQAASDWCRGQGWAVGIGPVDPGTDTVNLRVACAAGAAVRTMTPLAMLSARQPACTAAVLYSVSCRTASQRWCLNVASMGYVGGWGVLSQDGTSGDAVIGCTGGATASTSHATYAQLAALGCATPTVRSAACDAAMHAWCAMHGHVTGVGPVEYVASSMDATMLCLD